MVILFNNKIERIKSVKGEKSFYFLKGEKTVKPQTNYNKTI